MKHGGDITFRGGLLAATKRGGTREERRDSIAPADALITFPTPGENGAVDRDFLKKTVIVLAGNFEEVHSINITANALVTAGLRDFGANIKQNFSANTHYLLAGKNTPNKKIQSAEERGVRVINLNRMVRLLQGKLASVEDMNALVPLTKNNFTDTNYERAVTEPVLQTVISASVTANSTSFEDEHADMDAEMASIDTSNMVTPRPTDEPLPISTRRPQANK